LGRGGSRGPGAVTRRIYCFRNWPARYGNWETSTGPRYDARRAAYDLKKLRGKQIVSRIGKTRRYETVAAWLKAVTALIVLRDKAIKPLLAAAQELRPSRQAQNPRAIDITTMPFASP
jgi:hypothetical protein